MNLLELLSISTVNLYTWIIYGILVGFIAHYHDHRRAKGGIAVTVFFAVAGAVTGGLFANFLLAKQMIDLSIEGFLFAFVSALILAIFYRTAFRNSGFIQIKR